MNKATELFDKITINGQEINLVSLENTNGKYYIGQANTNVKVEFSLKDKTEIPSNIFKNNSDIRSIKIPNTIKKINDGAFENSALTYINIPEELTYISSTAFSNVNLPQDIQNKINEKIDNKIYGSSYLNVGDILVYDKIDNENKIKIISKSNYDNTYNHYVPVGVCVIPDNFISQTPNAISSFARFIYIDNVGYDESTGLAYMFDHYSGFDENNQPITNHGLINNYSTAYQFPIVNKLGEFSASNNIEQISNIGIMPVDNGNYVSINKESISQSDPLTYYYTEDAKSIPNQNAYFIASPYKLENGRYSFNSEQYHLTTYNGTQVANALLDIQGALNTYQLLDLETSDQRTFGLDVAKVVSNTRFLCEKGVLYVPAAGEAGFVLPRLNEINKSLETIGGTTLGYNSSADLARTQDGKLNQNLEEYIPYSFWTSTQASASSQIVFQTFHTLSNGLLSGGALGSAFKIDTTILTRPFFMYDPVNKNFVQFNDENPNGKLLNQSKIVYDRIEIQPYFGPV